MTQGLARLGDLLCQQLERAGLGGREFVLHAFKPGESASQISVTTARAVRKPAHILRLFAERLENMDPGFGIDLLVLAAHRTSPMDISAAALSGDLAAIDFDIAALSALADRITAKLGEGAVQVRTAKESHIPERSEQNVPFDAESAAFVRPTAAMGPRPLRLLLYPEPVQVLAEVPDGPPLRFIWRKVARKVARADGPERLAPEWWKASERGARARDYYQIEDEAGRRYWLFREGLYEDGRGGPPGWYVHGLFA
jgi:protein ImuB